MKFTIGRKLGIAFSVLLLGFGIAAFFTMQQFEQLNQDFEKVAEISYPLAKTVHGEVYKRLDEARLHAMNTSAKSMAVIFILFSAAILIAFAASFAIRRSITNRIVKLKEAVMAMGQGHLSHKVGMDAKDEIGELSRSFDEMAEKRARAEEDLKELAKSLEQRVEERTQQLKDAYEKLKEQSCQLIQAEKMTALGTMAAGVAHELNNPMMGVLNYIEYCLKKSSPEQKTHIVLEDAKFEIERCCRIVHDLLAFSRSGRSHTTSSQEQNCVTLLDNSLRLLAHRIEAVGVSVIRNVAPEALEAMIQGETFQQVFVNLVTNAVDAMKTSPKKELTVEVALEEESLRVAVSDTGFGIRPENLEKIFEPFFTTKPAGEGTGLGLPLCRSIVRDLRGEMTCESTPGEGTSFKILLPSQIKTEVLQ